jgi:outer membrane receptor protein involved in Fe transport
MQPAIRISTIGVIALALAAGCVPVYGQVVSGTIVGTIHDPSGAAIPATAVTVRNLDTNQTRESATNENGAFTFATLPPGRYRVSTTHPGFKSAVTSDIDLQIDQTARVDLTLEIGQVSEEVTVSASAIALQTDTATMGQVISEKPVADLPLNGRNFLDLANLTAGVVPESAGSGQQGRIGRAQLTTHVAGGRGYANSFLIDGIESRGARLGEISFLPSPDTIKEFKIQANYYSAEYGANPGIISISIKSGSNAFHGTAYEFLRNSALDEPQYFDQGEVAPFKQNQFGANLGGPILKDRTFFFFAYDGQRRRRSNQSFAVVPDPQYLTGNFQGLTDAKGNPIIIKNPFNKNAPFTDNTIPADMISKIAQNFNKYIPAPNTSLAQGNYTGNPATLDDFDQYHIKIDHRFSDNDSMFGRFSRSTWDVLNQGLLPYSGSSFPLNSDSAVIQETHIFGPSAVNTLKLGFNRDVVANSNEVADQNLAEQIGFKNLSVASYDYSLPRFNITGFTQMGHSQQTFHQWTNAYILSDTFVLSRGLHNITLGGDVRAYRSPTSTTNGTNGRITVSNIFTGYSLADYLLGTYQTATTYDSFSTGDFRNSQYALFVQDDYKILPRLTLNLGLRWEYNTPWRELGGSEGFFDQSVGLLRLANPPSIYGVNINSPTIVVGGVREGVFPPDYKQFAPRIGLAYKLNDKTVIRSGFGIFYLTNQGSHTIEISVNPGSAITISSTNSAGKTPRLVDTLFDTPAQALLSAGNSPLTVDAKVANQYAAGGRLRRKQRHAPHWNPGCQCGRSERARPEPVDSGAASVSALQFHPGVV